MRTDRGDRCTTLHATGALDYGSSPLLKEQTDAVLKSADHPRLVIDLTEVTFCDSTGYGVLMYALAHIRSMAGSLILVGIPSIMRQRLNRLGVGGLFDTRGTVEEAMNAFPATG
ncbi:STAS domain-containing protein [Streptosporangium lutulentum]|uniref:Anti-sigma factor antagonist n=1 Tax=Streptosporangium lutulentum TaxID=1461250 RepID=A0ABT9QVI5_9ACTN|nr:STAS domain-containing protein [Streptosporangium lutulentum]MDP9849939.1 anti-sigma B factor antagonist [Streptosporangium lutulentum]